MNKRFPIVFIAWLGCLGLFVPAAASDEAGISFTSFQTEDGRVIYSNIPRRCIRDGLLICSQYHPLHAGDAEAAKAAARDTSERAPSGLSASSGAPPPAVKKDAEGYCHAIGKASYLAVSEFTAFADMQACIASGGRNPPASAAVNTLGLPAAGQSN